MLSDQVRRTIDHYHLLEQNDRLVVGVSGGVDSMVLLHLLNSFRPVFNLFLVVAYVNHRLRPVESEREASFVEKESERLGLAFECGAFDVRGFQKSGGFSLQEAARRIRFQFFNHLLQKYQARKIALGHNADDQAETILLRLLRGAGLKGLKGMLPIREGRVIRPLLEVWRAEIESFAKENGILFLTDSSNFKRDYLRNRIRLDLIPLIEEQYQPKIKEILHRASTILRMEDDYLEQEAESSFQRIVKKEGESFTFQFSEYQSLHQALRWRVLQKLLESSVPGRGPDGKEWSDVNLLYERLGQRPASFFFELPHGLCLEKRYDRVTLRKGEREFIPPFEIELNVPGKTYIEEIGREVRIEEREKEQPMNYSEGPPDIAFLDYQKLRLPLKMRNFRPGDRFQPLGMKGTKKLKEYFIDHKIPKFERPGIPLLISGDKIAWAVGHRIDERFKITPETKRVLRVEVLQKNQ